MSKGRINPASWRNALKASRGWQFRIVIPYEFEEVFEDMRQAIKEKMANMLLGRNFASFSDQKQFVAVSAMYYAIGGWHAGRLDRLPRPDAGAGPGTWKIWERREAQVQNTIAWRKRLIDTMVRIHVEYASETNAEAIPDALAAEFMSALRANPGIDAPLDISRRYMAGLLVAAMVNWWREEKRTGFVPSPGNRLPLAEAIAYAVVPKVEL